MKRDVWIARMLKRIHERKKLNYKSEQEKIVVERITAPEDAKYLGEFLPKLPANTFLNKSATGVGATSLALTCEEKYIVAVPYQSLAMNKARWCEENGIEVLLVKSGVKKDEIRNFKGDKILVVFDSLWRLSQCLPDPKKYRLMVDEAHVVLTSASYRGKGMNSMLNHIYSFKDFILITATPTPILYGLKEFKDLRRIDIEWPNKKKIQFVRDVITHDDDYCLADKLILISKQHLEGEIESNAYIFINSVFMINRVVKALIKMKLVNPENVNLIVAEGNSPKLKVNLGIKYELGKPPRSTGEAKKLNFITSTAFEGSDFYDENGKIYIVSDGSRSHTKIDILTQLHQIAGRIRNSKLNDSIQIITVPNSTMEFDTDKQTFITKLKSEYKDEETIYNADLGKIKENKDNKSVYDRLMGRLLREAETNPYYYIDENGFVKLNNLFIDCQMHNWEVLNQSYVYQLDKKGNAELVEGNNGGINFIDKKVKLPPKAIGKAMLGKEYNFRELMIMYINARKEEDQSITEKIVTGSYCEDKMLSIQIGKLEPLIPEAYRILRPKGIASLNYSKTRIRKAIDDKAPINKMATHLKIRPGWYSKKEIKDRLQKYYNKVSPNMKAKSTEIFRYYIAEEKGRRIEGKFVRGIQIVGRIRNEKKKK